MVDDKSRPGIRSSLKSRSSISKREKRAWIAFLDIGNLWAEGLEWGGVGRDEGVEEVVVVVLVPLVMVLEDVVVVPLFMVLEVVVVRIVVRMVSSSSSSLSFMSSLVLLSSSRSVLDWRRWKGLDDDWGEVRGLGERLDDED